MTEKNWRRFAEEGWFWAEKIFEVNQFLAREHGFIPGSFLANTSGDLIKMYDVIDVLGTFDSCLERLRPRVFFGYKTLVTPGKVHSDRLMH